MLWSVYTLIEKLSFKSCPKNGKLICRAVKCSHSPLFLFIGVWDWSERRRLSDSGLIEMSTRNSSNLHLMLVERVPNIGSAFSDNQFNENWLHGGSCILQETDTRRWRSIGKKCVHQFIWSAAEPRKHVFWFLLYDVRVLWVYKVQWCPISSMNSEDLWRNSCMTWLTNSYPLEFDELSHSLVV